MQHLPGPTRIAMRLLLSMVLLSCSDATSPTTEAGGTAIVGIVEGQHDIELFRGDIAGQDTQTLLLEPGEGNQYTRLRISPDGTRLLFNREIASVPGSVVYQVGTDGQSLGLIEAPGGFPDWAPDGFHIGWLCRTGSGTQIVVTDLAGTTHDSLVLAESFAWAPDGNRMAITFAPANEGLDVGVVELANPHVRVNLTKHHGVNLLPSWSPDGTHIAFYSGGRTPGTGLYVMDADGGNQRLVVAANMRFPPVWSPNGRLLAIFDGVPADTRVRVVNLQGQPGAFGPFDPARVVGLTWSPSGRNMLVRVADTLGTLRLFVVAADGHQATELPAFGAHVLEAGWMRAP